MSFLAGDENLRPTKIKGHLKNLFKREVTNFLSTKKKQEKVFSLREIFWKNTNNLTRIKNYSLNGFSIFSQISSAFCTVSDIPVELSHLTIISFSFITWLYQSTIHLACMGFKSDNLDDILTSVGYFPFWSSVNTWSANQSLYLFWMNDFAALYTDKSNSWNLLVRLWGTITVFSSTQLLYLIGQKYLGLNFCHPWKILSLRTGE